MMMMMMKNVTVQVAAGALGTVKHDGKPFRPRFQAEYYLKISLNPLNAIIGMGSMPKIATTKN